MEQLTIVSPAPAWELRALFAFPLLAGPLPDLARRAMAQTLHTRTYGLLDTEGVLFAGLMFTPFPQSEMAFVCAPRADRARLLPHAISATRLIIAGRLETGTVAIRALVANEHRPGHRLALLTGFRPVDRDETHTVYEVT